MKHIEIKSWIESYKKKLNKSKSLKPIAIVKLPKLIQSHSYHNLIIRKIEKIKAANYRNRYNSGEKKVKAALSNMFSVQKVENDFFQKLVKVKTNLKYVFNKNNKNNNSLSSLNSFSNNSILKTTVSNNSVMNYNHNNFNNSSRFLHNPNNLNIKSIPNIINNNSLKIVKIKQTENSKNSPAPEELSSMGTIGDCCFFKKKYYINKNNFNKDIIKFIKDNNRCLFYSKFLKNPNNYDINAFSNIEEEKNEN